jgi:predicted enzyme related to lactoylglutathione lyase
MNRPVHFEIYTDNPETVQPFYRGVFGWTFTKRKATVDLSKIRLDKSR